MPDLKQTLYDVVSENVNESKIAVAFSGGVDSSLLAKICKDLGKQVMLVTIGFPGSHDLGFAKAISSKMGMEWSGLEIDYKDFQEDLRHVRRVIKCENTSHIENCIAYFYVCKLTKQTGLEVVLSANGCDELFCGYDGYRGVSSGGEEAIIKLMDEKLANEFVLVEEISTIASKVSITVKQPFLSTKFITFAKTIPVDEKIKGPNDMMRKHALREIALLIGVPKESAMAPKKALQYGSLIDKYFKKASSYRFCI